MSGKRSEEPAGKMSGRDSDGTTSNTRAPLSDTPSQPYSKSAVEPTLQKKSSSSRLPLTHSPATGTSPYSSRNTSPQRKESKQSGLSTGQVSTQPSAAAIQRALSASNVPQLANAAIDANTRVARTQRSAGSASQVENASSARLKSPSPGSAKRVTTLPSKKTDTPPSINIQSASAADIPNGPQTAPLPRNPTPSEQLQAPAKLASRGPSGKSMLETVDEDGDNTETTAAIPSDLKPLTKLVDEDGKTGSEAETGTKATESGSESGGGNDRPVRRASISSINKQSIRRAKNSYTSLAGSKVRQSDVPHNMTVETETVQSIPHSGLNVSSERSNKDRNDGNVVKVKSSTETIRPRKERRQPSKKARSINQGTASSKADIFEARVASAVDEANSSDSDETYVYESNPPEPRRPRHHSRTPSVTSAHSTAEPRSGIRNVGDVLDDRKVAGKRSMKFSNNPFNSSSESPTTDRNDGTVRAHHARHYGRFGRGGNHAAMFEPDSPYTQASRLRSGPHSLRHSRPGSPRSPQTAQIRSGVTSPTFGKRKDNPFGFDDGDERTPLMNTVRTPRSFRDPNRLDDGSHSDSSLDAYYGVRRRSRCGTLGGCLLGVLIFALVVISTVVFLFMSNRPLGDVYIRRIENVLASEQELMLDLRVGAVNPNALSIAIGDMDINIFAKSKYLDAPSKKEVKKNARMRSRSQILEFDAVETYSTPKKGHPDGNGSDFDSDSQTMLLGRILHFDQELNFAGSPISYRMHYSVGELRLAHPGNKTETGGTARWTRVLHHPFELIIRGVLKYKLPVSGREESAAIRASVLVHPEDGVDSMGRMRLEPVDHSDHWQWIDWDREKEMLEGIKGDNDDLTADVGTLSDSHDF